MDPLDFLKVACNLHESDHESDRRTSIGRSYFALFNYLRRKVESVKNVPASDEAHQAVVHYLEGANDRDLQSVGQSLRNLRASRNKADYHLDESVGHDASRVALARAKRAVKKFDSLGNRATSVLQSVPTFLSKR